MSKAFVYTEMQLSVPFDQAPWRDLNPVLLRQPGLNNKTWLSGVQNQSVGGFYEFDNLADAQTFAQDYFPTEAKKLGRILHHARVRRRGDRRSQPRNAVGPLRLNDTAVRPGPDGGIPCAQHPNFAGAGPSAPISSTCSVAWPMPKRSFSIARASSRNASPGWPSGITRCAVSTASVVLIGQMWT